MDELKKRIRKYWRERSEGFAALRQKELSSAMADVWKKELKAVLPNGDNLNILDVGAGGGFFAVLLSQMGHNVIGADLSEKMIEQAAILAKNAGVTPKFVVMDAEKLDFADDTFDVAVSRNLTWNLERPDEAYGQWLRVLKPNGVLINFDAEYGKKQYSSRNKNVGAHSDIADDVLAECDAISKLLPLSAKSRPQWDIETLKALGAKEIRVDTEVSARIYTKADEFYNSADMFCIRAIKG